jgi:hypothetical protein
MLPAGILVYGPAGMGMGKNYLKTSGMNPSRKNTSIDGQTPDSKFVLMEMEDFWKDGRRLDFGIKPPSSQ